MNISKRLFSLLPLLLAGCGGGVLDPCVDITCPSGEACVVVNGVANCQVPSDSDGMGQFGDSCFSDNDCAPPLVCSELNGIPVCSN